jgi:hypothetical protein
MPFVLLLEKGSDIQGLALTGIERTNALVDVSPQLAQFFYVRQQPLTNLFLIRVRQIRDFRDRFFERPDHAVPYSISAAVRRIFDAISHAMLANV